MIIETYVLLELILLFTMLAVRYKCYRSGFNDRQLTERKANNHYQATGIKTQEDLGKLTGFIHKLVIETALNEKMVQYLGHKKIPEKRGSNL